MTDNDVKATWLKDVFFYHPFGDFSDNPKSWIRCTCGKLMKEIGRGGSFSTGDIHFECDCGKKLLMVYGFVGDFPKSHDNVSINVKKCKCGGCRAFRRKYEEERADSGFYYRD